MTKIKSKNLLCNICGNTFSTVSLWQGHMEFELRNRYADYSLDDGKFLDCGYCTSKFKSLSTLISHVKSRKCMSVIDRIYECAKCLKCFKHRGGLEYHYIYSVCSQSFDTNRAFECGCCKIVFSSYRKLEKHVHRDCIRTIRIVSCKKCGHGFIGYEELSEHHKSCIVETDMFPKFKNKVDLSNIDDATYDTEFAIDPLGITFNELPEDDFIADSYSKETMDWVHKLSSGSPIVDPYAPYSKETMDWIHDFLEHSFVPLRLESE